MFPFHHFTFYCILIFLAFSAICVLIVSSVHVCITVPPVFLTLPLQTERFLLLSISYVCLSAVMLYVHHLLFFLLFPFPFLTSIICFLHFTWLVIAGYKFNRHSFKLWQILLMTGKLNSPDPPDNQLAFSHLFVMPKKIDAA